MIRMLDPRAVCPLDTDAVRTLPVKSATLIFEAAGYTPTPERIDELSRVLNGFVFSNLTIAPEPGTQDAAGLVDRLLSAFLD
jgi:hypothetical protein